MREGKANELTIANVCPSKSVQGTETKEGPTQNVVLSMIAGDKDESWGKPSLPEL